MIEVLATLPGFNRASTKIALGAVWYGTLPGTRITLSVR
jgi:hypothetical protein